MIWVQTRTRDMTKFNWDRPRSRTQTWAYDEALTRSAAPRRHSQQDWQRARTARRIKDLDERIASGKGWMQTIPTTDPRHARWSRKLVELIAERQRLTG